MLIDVTHDELHMIRELVSERFLFAVATLRNDRGLPPQSRVKLAADRDLCRELQLRFHSHRKVGP